MTDSFTLSFDGGQDGFGHFDAPEPVSEPAPVAPRRRRRRRWPFVVLFLLLLTVALVIGWGLYRYSQVSSIDVPGVEPAASGRTANWLFVGTDTRDELDPNSSDAELFINQGVEGKRADTIMVVQVDGATGEAHMLSIPRDLWLPIVQVDGSIGETGRINGAFNVESGGQQRLVATIEQNLNIDINHYAEVNFIGFGELVNAIGGVEICVDTPMRDQASGLSIETAGCHILDGEQGLAYVRGRKVERFIDGQWVSDPSSDFGRTTRQREFLAQVAKSASGELGPTSIRTMDQLARVAGDHLLIEDGDGPTDLVRFARAFSSASDDQVIGHALPVDDVRTSGGAAVLQLREAEAQPILDFFRS